MIYEEITTQQRILNAGKEVFLEKGFQAASLRTIAKKAGVTTGAFYGYYDSKEKLFDALVKEHYDKILTMYGNSQKRFQDLPPQEQKLHMGDYSGDSMWLMIDYIYEHFDAFKLILCCSDGTKYADFTHTMVEMEIASTDRFIGVLKDSGQEMQEIDYQLEHILVSSQISGFFEIVIHDMPKEKAQIYLKVLIEFHIAGWKKIMGLPISDET